MSWFSAAFTGLYRSARVAFVAILILFTFIKAISDTPLIQSSLTSRIPIEHAQAEDLGGDWGMDLLPDPATQIDAKSDSDSNSSDSATESGEEGGDEDSDKKKEEEKKEKEKKEKEKKEKSAKDGHSKELFTPQPTPTALPTVAASSAREEQLNRELDKIRNPKNNEEALERVAADPKRKLNEAIAEARTKGKEIDLFSNRRYSPEMEAQYSALESTVKQGILNGTMDERTGLQMLAQARLGGRIFTAGGEKLNGIVPDNWNPGLPYNRSGNMTAGFQLQDAQSRAAATFRNMNQLLTDPRATPTLGGLSRLEVARQYSYYFLDHTATAQGNWGSCWTCSAEAMGWAWRPDQMSSGMNQLIFTQRFVSPFSAPGGGQPYSINYSVSDLMPSRSNLGFNMNNAGSGEQSYVNMLGQRLIGNIAGNSQPWNGGDPGAASRALYTVAGIYSTPTQSGVGGVQGLMQGINEGTMKLVQYIPFPGHSASNSGKILPTTDGGFLGFGINDNSWGQNGEHMFLATPENASKFKFPGGIGSMFGGPGGAMGMANGLMSGLLGGMQGQPVSPEAATAAQSATQQQQSDAYSKLNTYERFTVRSVCVQAVGPKTSSLPHVCRLALTDKTLPGLLSGPAFKPAAAGGTMGSF